ENGTVTGLKVKLENGEKIELKSKLVIDASGFYSPIRKALNSSLIEKTIPKEDSILCYREIIKFSPKAQEIQDPEYITIILDQEKAPGGYIWYFPKNESSINIGLGAFMDYKGKVKDLYHKHVFQEYIKTPKYKIISTGGGVVPVRRPLWSCADNGIILIGDSACQVNPLHGGGIDPSMRAGFYAANSATRAIEENNVSINALWGYNHQVMTNFGAEFAALDLLRIVLQTLSNDDINFGLERDLLTGEEILEISSKGELNLSIITMAKKAIKGISRPNLLLDLNFLRIKMNEINSLYKSFPDALDRFPEWKEKVIGIYDKIRKMIVKSKKK
ncbi:MAG: tryptophan 7-halogenase, partial [Candidatus Lokiarchaeota archaeon]|nr:tryptophan 7-halogenase [Candidatus Lokiarchaeota archaeon]